MDSARDAAGGVGRRGAGRPTASGCAAAPTTRSASPCPTARWSAPSTASRACRLVHPGAVYLHQGQTYRVRELDLDDGAPSSSRSTAASTPSPESRPTSPSSDRRRHAGRGPQHAWPRSVSGACRGSSATSGSTPSPASCSASRSCTCRRRARRPGRSGTRSASTCCATPACRSRGRARHAARRRARGHRHAAAVHHLRPLGRRRRVDADCRPRPALPTIVIYDGYPGGAGIAELGYASRRPPPAGHARGGRRPAAARRLPVVRAVTQVRQRQRAARQGRRGRAAAHVARLTPSRRRLASHGGLGGQAQLGHQRPGQRHIGWIDIRDRHPDLIADHQRVDWIRESSSPLARSAARRAAAAASSSETAAARTASRATCTTST